MDWKAFGAVGAATLVLGIVLLVPGLMLGRKVVKPCNGLGLLRLVQLFDQQRRVLPQ
ncbi:hypothetical protein [Shewanella fodinae]|uniref:Uncharacterized protein n=1 Tax=Shewanella fodinae TaxID=552357 RepID=A0A4R2F9R5_9GAMM|nr:hypothetical protein [Shewanella fodinae]TCN82849.1 hypothetical protein EDC91_11770 [Shewanella fodinae]